MEENIKRINQIIKIDKEIKLDYDDTSIWLNGYKYYDVDDINFVLTEIVKENQHYKSKLTNLKALLEEKVKVLQSFKGDFRSDTQNWLYEEYQEILKEIGEINE